MNLKKAGSTCLAGCLFATTAMAANVHAWSEMSAPNNIANVQVKLVTPKHNLYYVTQSGQRLSDNTWYTLSNHSKIGFVIIIPKFNIVHYIDLKMAGSSKECDFRLDPTGPGQPSSTWTAKNGAQCGFTYLGGSNDEYSIN